MERDEAGAEKLALCCRVLLERRAGGADCGLLMSFDKAGLTEGKGSGPDSGADWGEVEARFALRRDEAVDTVLRARSIFSQAG